jgi:dipeptidyl aminopeptidase/acylaminoacyl peptidase
MLMVTSLFSPAFAELTKETLFSTPSFISAKISPNGKTVVRVGADKTGISNVFIREREAREWEQITFYTTPEIIQFFWSSDSQKVLVLKDEEGKAQLHLHGVDIQTKKVVVYTEQFSKVNTKLIQIGSEGSQIVVGLNHRSPQFHDLYLLDLDTGKFDLLFQNDLYAKFLVSDQLELILKMRINEDGSWTVLTADDAVFMQLSEAEAFQTEFLSYDERKQAVFLLDNRSSDMNQLMCKFLDGKEVVLGGQTDSDVDEVLFLAGKPVAYASYYTHKKWHAIDQAVGADVALLEQQIGGGFEVINTSYDGNFWVVSNSVPDRGVAYWIYDRKGQEAMLLHGSPAASASKMYPLVVTARDGQELVCYYTLPKEVDRGGHVDAPIPLVVVPHGGPFKVRDKFEFNSLHQWLASRGYAVLSVNFRLSSGFGKAFVNAGNGQWGGKAHLDVVDAVEACIAKGITERGKLAVVGGSYGGYESLASLTFTPDYFTCCVSICGPSNLKTVLDNVPKFWEFTAKPMSDKLMFFTKAAFITSMGGHPDRPEGIQYLEKCSPLNHLEGIQAPLLLIHGKNDHIVAEKESKQIYDSMKKKGLAVTYILFSDEGHRPARFANKMFYLDHTERFLSEHLEGRYQAVGKEILADSSGQILN